MFGLFAPKENFLQKEKKPFVFEPMVQNQAQVLIPCLAKKKDLMFKQKSQILRIDFKEEELAVEPLCLFKMFLLNLQEYPLHQNKKLFQLQ